MSSILDFTSTPPAKSARRIFTEVLREFIDSGADVAEVNYSSLGLKYSTARQYGYEFGGREGISVIARRVDGVQRLWLVREETS